MDLCLGSEEGSRGVGVVCGLMERNIAIPGMPTQGSSWGYLKVNFSESLSIFGYKCPQNGSKNDLMAPRTTLECPHEGPSAAYRGTSLTRKHNPLGPYRRPMPEVLGGS